jgi:hypothetical protein
MTDGKEMTATVVLSRSSGELQGLVGTWWKAMSIRSSEPTQQKIDAMASSGLRATGRNGFISTWTFDGKPNLTSGLGDICGMTDSAKVVNERTIEVTLARKAHSWFRVMAKP